MKLCLHSQPLLGEVPGLSFCGWDQSDLQPQPSLPAAIFISWVSVFRKENCHLALICCCPHISGRNCKVLREVGTKIRPKEDGDTFYSGMEQILPPSLKLLISCFPLTPHSHVAFTVCSSTNK